MFRLSIALLLTCGQVLLLVTANEGGPLDMSREHLYSTSAMRCDPAYSCRNQPDDHTAKKVVPILVKGQGASTQVYLQQAVKNPQKGWKMIRGTPKMGEDGELAFHRETFEETGIHHDRLTRVEGVHHGKDKGKPFTAKVFRVSGDDEQNLPHENSHEGKWFPAHDAHRILREHRHDGQAKVLEKALLRTKRPRKS